MKSNIFLKAFLTIFWLIFANCEREYELPNIHIDGIMHITSNSAIININLDDNGTVSKAELVFSKHSNPNLSDSLAITRNYNLNYTSVLKNLEPETTYYIRFYISNYSNSKYSKEYEFTTSPKLSFTDERDGHLYEYVKIGNQTWMAENLDFKTKSGSWYYNNDSILYKKLGRLYTYEQACSACPHGWHLPSDDEWRELELHLGMSIDETYVFFRKPNIIGNKLMSLSDNVWYSNNHITNETGFNAMGSGQYSILDNHFNDFKSVSVYWGSSEYILKNDSFLIVRAILSFGDLKRLYFYPDITALSVRCIKD